MLMPHAQDAAEVGEFRSTSHDGTTTRVAIFECPRCFALTRFLPAHVQAAHQEPGEDR